MQAAHKDKAPFVEFVPPPVEQLQDYKYGLTSNTDEGVSDTFLVKRSD